MSHQKREGLRELTKAERETLMDVNLPDAAERTGCIKTLNSW